MGSAGRPKDSRKKIKFKPTITLVVGEDDDLIEILQGAQGRKQLAPTIVGLMRSGTADLQQFGAQEETTDEIDDLLDDFFL